MVKIRLARHGTKKRPFYRIVVADQRKPRDGRFIEILGTYDPTGETPAVNVKEDRVKEWLAKGAQASETVRNLLRDRGMFAPDAAPADAAATS